MSVILTALGAAEIVRPMLIQGMGISETLWRISSSLQGHYQMLALPFMWWFISVVGLAAAISFLDPLVCFFFCSYCYLLLLLLLLENGDSDGGRLFIFIFKCDSCDVFWNQCLFQNLFFSFLKILHVRNFERGLMNE